MTKGEGEGRTSRDPHIWVKDIRVDNPVRGIYLVRNKKLGQTKRGDPFLSLTLSDRTGDVESRVWERAEEFHSVFKEGDIIEVEGNAGSYRNEIQLTLSDLRIYEGEFDSSIFLESTTGDIKEMMGSLRVIMKEIEDTHLKALTERFFADHLFIEQFKKAPAAKNFHHNYIGGLLEHTLSVCKMSLAVAGQYPGLDRDLLITAAFLHDIGKIREFKCDRGIDYTDEGRLIGHLIAGVAMVDEKLAQIRHFPAGKALRLKHLIISHHGQYEFGSPKRPKFLEAFALHLIDDLDAKMNGLGRYMEKDRQEGAWTDYNRMFERYLLKNLIPEDEGVKESHPSDNGQKALFTPRP